MGEMLRALVLAIILLRFSKSEDAPFVETKQGVLKGKYWKSQQGRTFSGFSGVPYGKPPVGELRFEAPEPAGPWNGILDASSIHEACPQVNIYAKDFDITGVEDCLYLNIYTPKLSTSEEDLLPVIFYIHGGSFQIGSARPDWLGPEILLDRDVVLVTLNYRLGALGFLSTGDDLVPGNNGLKDQNLALKWVQDNIIHFGGDPDKVTVAGNSAGGASAHFHMLSPLSKNLIKGVIALSGSAINAFAISGTDEAVNNAFKLGHSLNCFGNNSKELVGCLKEVDAYKLIEQQSKWMGWDNDTTVAPFRPVVEPDLSGTFLTQNPLKIMETGQALDVPFMTGIVSQEGAYKAAGLNKDDTLLVVFDRYFDMVVASDFRIGAEEGNMVIENLRKFYFEDQPINNFTKSELTDMYTDGWFLWGLDKTASLHAKHATQPVYLYLFEYRGSASYSTLFGDSTHNYGVCHTDDLIYLLTRNSLFPKYEPTDQDNKMAKIMTTLWDNFAKTGNPTPDDNLESLVKWEPLRSDALEYYHIRSYSDIRMESGLLWNRTQFWREVPVEVTRN